MINKAHIRDLQMKGRLTAFDVHFARFIDNYAADQDADLGLAAALVSHATAQGDICLDLCKIADQPLLGRQDEHLAIVCPQLEAWLEKLKASPAVGSPGEIRPLILDSQQRLYLYRYWEYEQTIAHSIKHRIEKPMPDPDFEHLRIVLNRLFPKTEQQKVDWQKIAAAVACLRHFCVITGGPGTGKTFVVSKILALLLEWLAVQPLRIYLAAPTGKAAARLQDALKQARDHMDCAETIKNAFPSEVFTIHRMLKPIKGSPYFHFDSENQLLADVVIVDEASMVDVALMAKLLRAVPDEARLIFIGDKDQLASVEAGSVLGDICDRDTMHGFSAPFKKQVEELTGENLDRIVQTAQVKYGLQDSIVVLHKSYRFDVNSGIGALSRAVNHGDVDVALTILDDATEESLDWRRLQSDHHLMEALSEHIISAYRPYLTAGDPAGALSLLENFKILCVLNRGPLGVQALNRLAEQVLSRYQLIQPDPNTENPWYAGRPVLITRNHYPLGLFNGDIGITFPGASSKEWVVYFSGPEGEDRRFLTHQLPEHETVYAMTVHKSQGSEFDDVLLILPNKDVPILTRELIYTALTRARRKINICGTPEILRSALTRKIKRTSGLRDALWGDKDTASFQKRIGRSFV